jgi:hypothetical protein
MLQQPVVCDTVCSGRWQVWIKFYWSLIDLVAVVRLCTTVVLVCLHVFYVWQAQWGASQANAVGVFWVV